MAKILLSMGKAYTFEKLFSDLDEETREFLKDDENKEYIILAKDIKKADLTYKYFKKD